MSQVSRAEKKRLPSPVYQWKKAFLRAMAENWWPIRLNSVMMEVLLPMNVADIFKPRMEEGQMCLDS